MGNGLVLIDIQNDYFPGGAMELEGAEKAAQVAQELLSSARNARVPVFHIQHLSVRPGSTFFLPETPGADIHERVAPLPGEPVVVKHFPNSFRETHLNDLLNQAGVDRLVLAGMMTHMCLEATTRAAFDLGYPCTVAFDACATRALHFKGQDVPAAMVQAVVMAALGQVYARILDANSVIREWTNSGS